MVLLFYTTYISVDLAHHKIFFAKAGKGGINMSMQVGYKCLITCCQFLHLKWGHFVFHDLQYFCEIFLKHCH